MAESAVMYSVGSQLIRTGQAETTPDIHLYQMLVGGSPYQSQRKRIITIVFFHLVTVPLIKVYLFLGISLFLKIIGKVNIFMRRNIYVSVVIPSSSADGEHIVRSVRCKPEYSGGGTVIFGQ